MVNWGCTGVFLMTWNEHITALCDLVERSRKYTTDKMQMRGYRQGGKAP